MIFHALLNVFNVFNLSFQLLKAVLKSCCSVYVTEWYSISQGFETSPDKHFYIRDWGKHGNVDDLEVSWHVPSVEELEYTDELLREILLPEIEVMKKYMSGSSLTRLVINTSIFY